MAGTTAWSPPPTWPGPAGRCWCWNGWTTLRLETGPAQPEAVALYTRAGYRPIGAFGHYVRADQDWSLYFERTLT